MLKELHLKNFRGFEDHLLPIRPTTVIVGRNNAGKSSIAEALRLLSIVVNRHRALNFLDVPSWLRGREVVPGVRPSLRGLEINFKTIFHRYEDPPAVISATFDSGAKVVIYVGQDADVHAIIEDSRGRRVRTKRQARTAGIPSLATLPQIGPLAREEQVLTPRYVRRSMGSSLSSLHFRNQLNLLSDLFEDFSRTAEDTWTGLQVRDLVGRGALPGSELSLLIRDGDFVAEVGSMGHGLQMWLQTIWFLTYSQGAKTLILDEPDVYLHADLQRRLIRLLKGRPQQVIIATHSVEVIAEVEPEELLVVDRRKPRSRFTTSLRAVQRVIHHVGGVHNIQLTRLAGSHRFLIVEGKDVRYLKQFQDRLFPRSPAPFDMIACMPMGGWGGWNVIANNPMRLRNAAGERIVAYCLLDSDYHTHVQIQQRLAQAERIGVELHVWRRKEIENYLLVPATIARVISLRSRARSTRVDAQRVAAQIDIIAEGERNAITDAMAAELFNSDRKGGLTKANRGARKVVDEAWATGEGRLSLVSGKKVISALSAWSDKRYGASFGAATLARELSANEIPEEVRRVVTSIENNTGFGRNRA
ncbi:AAA family ATPase [bacterium]|nr:AAA family ATPase [bacterium]